METKDFEALRRRWYQPPREETRRAPAAVAEQKIAALEAQADFGAFFGAFQQTRQQVGRG